MGAGVVVGSAVGGLHHHLPLPTSSAGPCVQLLWGRGISAPQSRCPQNCSSLARGRQQQSRQMHMAPGPMLSKTEGLAPRH